MMRLSDWLEGFLIGSILGVGASVVLWAMSYGIAARTAADVLDCDGVERKWQCPGAVGSGSP